jgi:hypothetical protein
MLLSRHQRILTEPHKHIAQQLQLHLHRTAANAAAATAVTRTFSRGPNAAQRGQPETPAAAPAAAHSYPSETSKSAAGMLPALPSMDPAADSLQPLTIEETLQAVAMPPTGQNLGPRVEHVHVAAAGLLSEAIASALQLPQSFVLELIRFGAVHYCPVMPQPSPKVGESAAHVIGETAFPACHTCCAHSRCSVQHRRCAAWSVAGGSTCRQVLPDRLAQFNTGVANKHPWLGPVLCRRLPRACPPVTFSACRTSGQQALLDTARAPSCRCHAA